MQAVPGKTKTGFNWRGGALDHHHDDADHHSPDSSSTCHDITIVAGTTFTTTEQPFGGKEPAHAYPPSVIPDGYAVLRATYTIEYPALPPPRTLPFYLRTSRILI